MKKLLLLLSLNLAIVGLTSAQDETDSTSNTITDVITKVFSTKVKLNVDANLFPQQQGNFYLSETPVAMIMCLVAPQSFEKAAEGMEKDLKKKDVTIKEKGEFKANGKTILFQKGLIKKDGKKLVLEMYAVKGDEERTIFVTSFYEPSEKARFEKAIKTAVISAELGE